MNRKITVAAPGRINIIGEHTDYNGGFVLPAAINKQITIEVEKNGHPSHCVFEAKDLGKRFEFDWAQGEALVGGWQNYLIGVTEELRKLGGQLSGFNASFSGNVPIGSGMSSSAALECSLAMALNELFELGLDRMTLVQVAQRAEHNYVGTKCGIMDQFASMMSKAAHATLLDCRSLEYSFIPLALNDYEILIINTNVSHSLSDSEYNLRREECEKGVALIAATYPEVKLLRDVSLERLDEFKTQLSPLTYQRCHYVISENNRVLAAVEALQNGDLASLGQLMYQSHDGLENDYEVSCPELDFLVAQTRDKAYILGARMMGGGFGGCTINLIEKSHSQAFVAQVAPAYEAQFGFAPTPYYLMTEAGTKVLD